MAVDMVKHVREHLRWLILETLNSARPIGANEDLILNILNDVQGQVTTLELRKQLDYLEDRKLIEITGKDGAIWKSELTRHGVDVVEYTIECEAGIARPGKYW